MAKPSRSFGEISQAQAQAFFEHNPGAFHSALIDGGTRGCAGCVELLHDITTLDKGEHFDDCSYLSAFVSSDFSVFD